MFRSTLDENKIVTKPKLTISQPRTVFGELTNKAKVGGVQVQKKTIQIESNPSAKNETKATTQIGVTSSVGVPHVAQTVQNVGQPVTQAIQLEPMDIDVHEEIEDIDSSDLSDPQFCSEYVPYIFAYLKKKEVTIILTHMYYTY